MPVSVALRGRDGGGTAELGDDTANALRASQGGGDKPHVLVPVAYTATDYESGAFAAAAAAAPLTTSADRTRAAPIVAFAQNQRDEVRIMECAGAVAAEPGMKQQTYVAFSAKDHGADAGDIAPTLRAGGHAKSHANAGVMPAVAFAIQERAVCENPDAGPDGKGVQQDVAYTLEARAVPQAAATASAVRRLTPEECEALQAFPSGWTKIPLGKTVRKQRKNEPDAHYAAYIEKRQTAADGPRYKSLGNAFNCAVVNWIGRRIDAEIKRAVREEKA